MIDDFLHVYGDRDCTYLGRHVRVAYKRIFLQHRSDQLIPSYRRLKNKKQRVLDPTETDQLAHAAGVSVLAGDLRALPNNRKISASCQMNGLVQLHPLVSLLLPWNSRALSIFVGATGVLLSVVWSQPGPTNTLGARSKAPSPIRDSKCHLPPISHFRGISRKRTMRDF